MTTTVDRESTENAGSSNVGPVLDEATPAARVHRVVTEYYDFVWRSLRRLGVPESAADDCAQQVFCVYAQRVADVPPDKERSFLFGTAMRTARTARRTVERSRSDGDAALDLLATPSHEAPDAKLEERRARVMLDEIIAGMGEELSAVFVLHEIEEATMAEIASILELPAGTVASRLRRAREVFSAACAARTSERKEALHE